MKGQDAFERSLREALDTYEVPYNSADWAQLEQRLDNTRPPLLRPTAALYALLLGGALATFTTARMLLSDPALQPPEGHAGLALVHEEAPERERTGPSASTDSTGDATATPPATENQVKKAERKPIPAGTPKADGATSTPPSPTVAAPERREAVIRPSLTEGCPGSEIAFATEQLDKNGMHLWNFGDGSFSNKPEPVHQFGNPGTYRVMLSHSAPGGGTIQNKPVSDMIVIHEAPEAAFDPFHRTYENTVPTVHFENRSQGGKSYLWDFGDGNTSTAAHPDHVFKKKGTYTVELKVTNGKGCVDRTSTQVTIEKDYDLLAPKAFSPNGDGVDDLFIPEALKTLGAGFHLSVFDPATGALVYETNDPTRPWNGRLNNKGDTCAPGDYTWMVDMKDGAKLGGSYSGTVNLLR